jgi:hypothetical protein
MIAKITFNEILRLHNMMTYKYLVLLRERKTLVIIKYKRIKNKKKEAKKQKARRMKELSDETMMSDNFRAVKSKKNGGIPAILTKRPGDLYHGVSIHSSAPELDNSSDSTSASASDNLIPRHLIH